MNRSFLARGLLPAAFLLLAGVLAIHPVVDSDFWLHRAVGDFILEHRQIPQINQFSYTCPDHPWLDVYWLYQVTVSTLWRVGQAPALVAFKTALSLGLAALVVFGLRDRRAPVTSGEAVVLLLGWLVMTPRLTDRPELISFLVLAAMLVLLRSGRCWWCIPLQVVWANVQGYFYWGILLLGLWAAGQFWEGRWRNARAGAVATLVAVLASAVSPLGWQNWRVGWEFAGTLREFHSAIDELASPFHPVVWSRDGNSLMLVVFIALAALLAIARWPTWTPFDRLLAAVSLMPALVSQRTAPLFVLGTLPALLASVRTLTTGESPWRPAVAAAAMILLAGDFVTGAGRVIRFRGGSRQFGWTGPAPTQPVGAVEFLRGQSPVPRRVFNAHFHTGGYLLAASDTTLTVFADGRLEAYPPGFIRRYLQVFTDDSTFDQLAREYGVTHLLLVKDHEEVRRLGDRLREHGDWHLVYTDAAADVLERSAPVGNQTE